MRGSSNVTENPPLATEVKSRLPSGELAESGFKEIPPTINFPCDNCETLTNAVPAKLDAKPYCWLALFGKGRTRLALLGSNSSVMS